MNKIKFVDEPQPEGETPVHLTVEVAEYAGVMKDEPRYTVASLRANGKQVLSIQEDGKIAAWVRQGAGSTMTREVLPFRVVGMGLGLPMSIYLEPTAPTAPEEP